MAGLRLDLFALGPHVKTHAGILVMIRKTFCPSTAISSVHIHPGSSVIRCGVNLMHTYVDSLIETCSYAQVTSTTGQCRVCSNY